MKPCLLAILALVASWVVLLSPPTAFADRDKEAELLKRIEQLEKRVAELERAIKELRSSAKEAPLTATEKKLVGTWELSDKDKKDAAFTHMKLNGDGTCAVVLNSDLRTIPNATYRAFGTRIVFNVPFIKDGNLHIEYVIASVTENELIIEQKAGDKSVKVRYTRAK
jgi:hypothetical protein